MRLFTVYDLSTGQIQRVGKCSDADLVLQVLTGEGLIPDIQGDPHTQVVDQTGETPVLISRPPPDLSQQKDTLLAHLAERRWAVETGGITIAGTPIRTDRESQAMLSGALNLATLDPELTVRWKDAEGDFVELDADAIRAVALAVGRHIQACFAREAELTEWIVAADEAGLTDLASAVATFWP